MNHRLPVFPLLLVLSTGLCAGCGGTERAQVQGSLVIHGKPFSPKENEAVEIAFLPADPENPTQSGGVAEFNPSDGTFVLITPGNRGLEPGRYKITVESRGYGGEEDRFGEEFSADATTLVHEVTREPNQAVVIDLGTQTVSRK